MAGIFQMRAIFFQFLWISPSPILLPLLAGSSVIEWPLSEVTKSLLIKVYISIVVFQQPRYCPHLISLSPSLASLATAPEQHTRVSGKGDMGREVQTKLSIKSCLIKRLAGISIFCNSEYNSLIYLFYHYRLVLTALLKLSQFSFLVLYYCNWLKKSNPFSIKQKYWQHRPPVNAA